MRYMISNGELVPTNDNSTNNSRGLGDVVRGVGMGMTTLAALVLPSCKAKLDFKFPPGTPIHPKFKVLPNGDSNGSRDPDQAQNQRYLSRVYRHIDFNYSGDEAKELKGMYRKVADMSPKEFEKILEYWRKNRGEILDGLGRENIRAKLPWADLENLHRLDIGFLMDRYTQRAAAEAAVNHYNRHMAP